MEISSMKTLSSSSSSYPSGGDGHISEDSSGSLVIHGNNKMGSLPNQHKMANKPPTSQTPNNNNYFDDEMDIHDMEQATHIATQISTAQSTESPSTQNEGSDEDENINDGFLLKDSLETIDENINEDEYDNDNDNDEFKEQLMNDMDPSQTPPIKPSRTHQSS
eukprot:531284_1